MQSALVQRIEKEYVGEDCVQVMFKYDTTMGILKGVDNPEKVFMHSNESQEGFEYINNYVKDERRFKFPYSDIPFHKVKERMRERTMVNQLLDYDVIYRVVRDVDKKVLDTYCKVIKDGNSALIIQDSVLSYPFYMTAEELNGLQKIYYTPEPKIRKR